MRGTGRLFLLMKLPKTVRLILLASLEKCYIDLSNITRASSVLSSAFTNSRELTVDPRLDKMASLPHLTNIVDSTDKSISIAIIGGGIGGLCLALGLFKQSHLDVRVYEAAHTFSEIGAGISIGLNAARALDIIGPAAKRALEKQSTGNLGTSQKMFQYKVVSHQLIPKLHQIY